MFSTQPPKARKHKRTQTTKLLPRHDFSCHTHWVNYHNDIAPRARVPERALQGCSLPCDRLAPSGETITLEQYLASR